MTPRARTASFAIALAATAICLFAHDIESAALAFLAGVVLTPLVASPVEWLVHRHVYHRKRAGLGRIHAVHEAHHHLYFPTSRYVTAGPPRRIALLARGVGCSTSRLANALTRVAHFLFYFGLGLVVICLPAWVLSRNPAFMAGVLAALVVVSDLFIRVHDAIHRPGSHPWLERQAWFRFLDKHHFIHHVDEDANVNFLLPLGDFMFGSLRTALTSDELRRHGSREDAKRLPRGLAAARGRVLPPAP